jgi:hypothetical protein
VSSCFERLTRRTWCRPQGTLIDPAECTTCDEPACAWSRARQRDRRCHA